MSAAIALAFAVTLAVIMTLAALHKLRSGGRFAASLAAYELLPATLSLAALQRVALGLAALELLLAVGLLLPGLWPVAAPAVALLLLAYAGAMAINLARGRSDIDCGCGDRPQPLSVALLVRNGVLALCALAVALTPGQAQWSALLVALPASAVLLLVYTAAEQLLENAAALKIWSPEE